MMRSHFLRGNRGFSIIECLVVLVLSSVLMAAFYRAFISQQRSSAVQDQVVEMRQNIRAGLDRMTREIRMAGYGGGILEAFGDVNSFTNIITPVNDANHDSVTILMADEVAKIGQNAAAGSDQLILNVSNGSELFDTSQKKYLCLNGQNNYFVKTVTGNTVTVATPLLEDHLKNESVALVKAITYKILPNTTDLVRDENAGGGPQVLAEGVEGLQLRYTLADGSKNVDSPGTPSEIRAVNMAVLARTKMTDPQYTGDGYRRQTLTCNVEVRNLGL